MIDFTSDCNGVAEIGVEATELVHALKMPKWLEKVERNAENCFFPTTEEQLKFVIDLAISNVEQQTGGPFGAAIFSKEDGKLIAVGVNCVVPSNQSWAHAEMVAFARAQNRLKTHSLKRCILVTSCEPCAMCFGATPWSGVEVLVYGAPGEFAREIGFDEGDKVADWPAALERRNIAVIGPLLLEEARKPFTIYGNLHGKIY